MNLEQADKLIKCAVSQLKDIEGFTDKDIEAYYHFFNIIVLSLTTNGIPIGNNKTIAALRVTANVFEQGIIEVNKDNG